MAATPEFKVYHNGEYIAATKYPEEAAAIACMREGTIVKYRHKHVVWQEGKESVLASDSWDAAANVMRQRVESICN